ncbi:MAG TPA: hypothetical protein VFT77_01540 [Reyranella sp.]|nr:hypothetical protein [Reyranella sp.]
MARARLWAAPHLGQAGRSSRTAPAATAIETGRMSVLGRLPRTGGYRVVAAQDVKISVLHHAGEARLQPGQIEGDAAS